MKEENVNTIQENQIVNYVKVPKFVFIIIIKHIVNYVKVRKFVFIINLNQLVKNVKITQILNKLSINSFKIRILQKKNEL